MGTMRPTHSTTDNKYFQFWHDSSKPYDMMMNIVQELIIKLVQAIKNKSLNSINILNWRNWSRNEEENKSEIIGGHAFYDIRRGRDRTRQFRYRSTSV